MCLPPTNTRLPRQGWGRTYIRTPTQRTRSCASHRLTPPRMARILPWQAGAARTHGHPPEGKNQPKHHPRILPAHHSRPSASTRAPSRLPSLSLKISSLREPPPPKLPIPLEAVSSGSRHAPPSFNRQAEVISPLLTVDSARNPIEKVSASQGPGLPQAERKLDQATRKGERNLPRKVHSQLLGPSRRKIHS